MSDEKKDAGRKALADMTEEEQGKVLDRSVVTSIYSHGDLVYEPGMSREEERIRTRHAIWRHQSPKEIEDLMAELVRLGVKTQEEGEAHKARLREQAERDRLFVEEADARRAERLRTEGQLRDEEPAR